MKLPKLSHAQRLALIFLLAIVLGLSNVGAKSFWLDEALSVAIATPRLEHVDSAHPPLFYTLLYYWITQFGKDEATVRLLSAIPSILTVGLLYLLARQLFARNVALLAAAFLALSPLNIWYAQEARMYSCLTFVTLLMALGLAWGHPLGFVIFFAALSAGLYLSFLTFPLWVGISALWFVRWWRCHRRPLSLLQWVLASAGAWWLYYPWWPYFQKWLQGSLLRHWLVVTASEMLGLAELTMWHFLIALVAATAAAVTAALYVPTLWAKRRWRQGFSAAAVFGFTGALILMPIPRLYGLKRVLVTGWPFVLLLVAWVVANLTNWRQPVQRALLGLSFIASLVTLLLVPKDDWRSVAAYLDAQIDDPNTVVWVDPTWNRFPHDYYRPEHPARYGKGADLQAVAAETDEIWFVAERFHGRPVPAGLQEAWLDQHWQLVKAVPFYRLEVRHYRLPAQ